MKRQLRCGMSIVVAACPANHLMRLMSIRLALSFLPILLLAWVAPAGAAPANDLCSGAIQIPGAGPFPFHTAVTDITTATTVNDPPITNSYLSTRVARSVWYRFTPSVTAQYTVTTCSDDGSVTTVEDTVLGVYTSAAGCSGPFVTFGFGDEDCGPNESQAAVTTQLLADTTYYIVVWKFCENCTDDGKNNVQLVIDGSIPPPNDTCSTATPIFVNLPAEGTTVGAQDTYRISGSSAFFGIDQTVSTAPGRDVVYSFTAPETTNYSFKVTSYDVNQNLVLHVAPTCPSGTPPITIANSLGAANRSGVNSAEEVVGINLTAGQEVFVIIDDNNVNAGSSFILEVTRTVREREPNNAPVDAAALVSGTVGSISPAFDVDFHALGRFPAGWRAFVMVDGEASRIANYDLRVTTTTDTLEFDDDNNDATFGDSSPNIAGTPLTGDAAYAAVNYFGNGEREPYRIHAVVQPPLAAATVESEPNNDWAHANVSEKNYFFGTVSSSGTSNDVDVFSFGVAEGDLIFLSLDGDPFRTNAPINAKLELLDSAGNPLAMVNDIGTTSSTNISTNTLSAFGPSSPGEALVHRSAVEGTFYARVTISPTAVGNARSGNYLLSIARNGLAGDGFNHNPSFTNLAVTSPISVGSTATLTGTLWESDLGDTPTLSVSWGDGTTNRINFPMPGAHGFSVPHQFNAQGNFTVTLVASDPSGGVSTTTTNIQVGVVGAAARFTAINPLPNAQFDLRLSGTPNAIYRIEKCNSLGSAWTELGVRTANGAGTFSIIDTAPAAFSRFYRAVSVP